MSTEKVIYMCDADVPVKQGFGYYRCSNNATRDPNKDGHPTRCYAHSAEAKAKRAMKSSEKYKLYLQIVDAKREVRLATEDLERVMRLIADDERGRADAKAAIARIDRARHTLSVLGDLK